MSELIEFRKGKKLRGRRAVRGETKSLRHDRRKRSSKERRRAALDKPRNVQRGTFERAEEKIFRRDSRSGADKVVLSGGERDNAGKAGDHAIWGEGSKRG